MSLTREAPTSGAHWLQLPGSGRELLCQHTLRHHPYAVLSWRPGWSCAACQRSTKTSCSWSSVRGALQG